MARANSMIVILVLICTAWCSLLARAQVSGGPVVASGTINIVLSNKNGFVIAADSRMSSDKLSTATADRGSIAIIVKNSFEPAGTRR